MTWATALTGLVGMAFERAVIEPSTPDAAHLWRRRAAAIRAWKQAVSETASSMPDREIPLARFWNEAAAAIRATVIRCVDRRRECVAVVDAMEARQWRFRAAFVCGMIEGEFPRHPAGDAFFDNAARQDLARLGIPLRSSEEDEAEEQALIAVAASRAEHVILSWPAFTPTGEDSLPAFAIETFPGDPVAAPLSRVEPVRAFQPPSRYSIADPAEIGKILGGRKTWRPTEIECFLQCPFQYLGRYTLKLEPAPPEPLERFDARVQGSLVHLILRRLTENPSLDLEAVLDEELRALMRTAHIPASHATLWHRTAMLRVVRMFLDSPVDRVDWNRAYEWGFEFDLVEGTRIKGRIDRFDSKNGAAFAIDYKYSKSERLKKSEAVQGGLYLLGLQAAGFRPQGFAFIALRDAEVVQYEPANLMATARERALEAVDAIVRGDIAVRPADPSLCRFCEFRPACRVAEMSGLAATAGDAE
jgi:ATP-dependent helicase/DNAse subunit B